MTSWALSTRSNRYGSFALPETDSGVGSDLDSKPEGYIVLYRNCQHCTDLESDPYSLFL